MKRLFLVLCICLLSTSVFAQDDIQVWSSAKATYALTSQVKLKADTEFRTSLGPQGLMYQHVDIGADFKLRPTSWAALGLYYRHVFEYKDVWVLEHRPHVDFKLKFQTWRFMVGDRPSYLEFSSRARYEHRVFEGSMDWRVRERLQAAAILLGTYRLHASNEFFVRNVGYSRNRLRGGADLIFKPFGAGVYGLLQTSGTNGNPILFRRDNQILVLGVRVGGFF